MELTDAIIKWLDGGHLETAILLRMINDQTSNFIGHCPEIVRDVFEPTIRYQEELADFSARNSLLTQDVGKCSKFHQKDNADQFWRRNIIKSFFSLVEATAYGLKRIAIHRNHDFEVDFSAAELAILLEQKYVIDEKGEAKAIENNFQRFTPNLKFAFRAFAKAHGFSFEWDSSAANLLKTFEQVRNRITHPKKLEEMSVTDAELETTQKLWDWFSRQFLDLVQKGMVNKSTLPIRMPPFPATRLGATKNYIVFLPNGDAYQFDLIKEAKAFEQSHRVKSGAINVNPILLRLQELEKRL